MRRGNVLLNVIGINTTRAAVMVFLGFSLSACGTMGKGYKKDEIKKCDPIIIYRVETEEEREQRIFSPPTEKELRELNEK